MLMTQQLSTTKKRSAQAHTILLKTVSVKEEGEAVFDLTSKCEIQYTRFHTKTYGA